MLGDLAGGRVFADTGKTVTSVFHATLIRDRKKFVRDLVWVETQLLVEAAEVSDRIQPVVWLHAKVAHADWTVNFGTHVLKLNPLKEGGAEFRQRVTLTEPANPMKLIFVDPLGHIYEESFTVEFLGLSDFRMAEAEKAKTRPILGLTFGLGPTLISYGETGIPDFTEIGITAKIQFQRTLFHPRVEGAVNAFGTLVSIAPSVPGTQLRFLGINGRVGYQVFQPQSKFRLTFFGGYYYISTFVSDNSFGFNNVVGPQVYPLLRWQFTPKDMVFGYGKYSPVNTNPVPDFNNHEFAFGGGWNRGLKNGHYLTIGIDYSNFGLRFRDVISISVSTLSFSASYTL